MLHSRQSATYEFHPEEARKNPSTVLRTRSYAVCPSPPSRTLNDSARLGTEPTSRQRSRGEGLNAGSYGSQRYINRDEGFVPPPSPFPVSRTGTPVATQSSSSRQRCSLQRHPLPERVPTNGRGTPANDRGSTTECINSSFFCARTSATPARRGGRNCCLRRERVAALFPSLFRDRRLDASLVGTRLEEVKGPRHLARVA